MSIVDNMIVQARFALEVNNCHVESNTREEMIAWMNSGNFESKYLDVVNELLTKVYKASVIDQNSIPQYTEWFNKEYKALKLHKYIPVEIVNCLINLLFKRKQSEDEIFDNISSLYSVAKDCPNIPFRNSCYIIMLRQLVNNNLILKDIELTQKLNAYIGQLSDKDKTEGYIPSVIRALNT